MGMEVNAYQAAVRGSSSRSSSQFERELMANVVSIQDASDALEKFMLDASRTKTDLSEGESNLYEQVTNYVRDEMNRAERFVDTDARRRNQVGFALTVLQRRLASSPEAIYKSLTRRKQRLEERINQEQFRNDQNYWKKHKKQKSGSPWHYLFSDPEKLFRKNT